MKSKYKPVGKLQSQNNHTWFHYNPAVNASLIHHILTKEISTDVLNNGENSSGTQWANGPGYGVGGIYSSAASTPPTNRWLFRGFFPLPVTLATSSTHLWTFFPLLLPTVLPLFTETFVQLWKKTFEGSKLMVLVFLFDFLNLFCFVLFICHVK